MILLLQLEEKQRADARQRKENNTEWEQAHFHLEGETWTFNNSLDKRKETFGSTGT